MSTATIIVALVLITALWDAFRRYVEAVRFNQAVLERLDALGKETARLHDQTQAILSKLQATQLNRGPMARIGRS